MVFPDVRIVPVAHSPTGSVHGISGLQQVVWGELRAGL